MQQNISRQAAWTNEELRVLKDISCGLCSMRSQLHKFPGRSYSSLNNKMIRMYGKREELPHYLKHGYIDRVKSFLMESRAATLLGISSGVGCSVAYLRRLMVPDDRPLGFYISGWTSRGNNITRYTPVFSFDEDKDSSYDHPHPSHR